MEKKSSVIVLAGYFYILLPILIFFAGYCNILTSFIGILMICIFGLLLCKNTPQLWIPSNRKEWALIMLILIISLVWVYSSGIGALVFQNLDHNCRNPIFEHLVENTWPVLSADKQYILTYYIGFWLPSALIGKIFNSIQIGYYFQIIWATFGVFLTFYYILASLKKKVLWPVFLFIFFSGMDLLGSLQLYGFRSFEPFEITKHLEWYYPGYQFSSFTTQLYWVFNQAIPAWVITLLLFHQKDSKNIIFLYSCMFLFSTIPAIGIFPFVIYWSFKNNINSIFTLQNFLGGSFILMVSYTYLSNNIAGGHITFQFISASAFMWWFILFFMLEIGFYILYIIRYCCKEILLYICLFCFLVYPFIHIGYSDDFCMRATIPALIIIFILITQTIGNSEFYKNKLNLSILIFLLFIGSFTPMHEITRTVIMTSHGITKAKADLGFENFFGYTKNSKFLKYFGKNNY
ncbi:hypothetical protein J6G99_07700 [bacterium]|nr:hypothetical protein [bacterium]